MLRVLLVEDSVMLAERLREALEQLDSVRVIGNVDGERDAIQAVRDHHPDVVVLDLQLRQGTGFGVLRALGKVRPVVIVLTNYALPEYKRQAKEFGVEHFLHKSMDYERLADVIAAVQADLRH